MKIPIKLTNKSLQTIVNEFIKEYQKLTRNDSHHLLSSPGRLALIRWKNVKKEKLQILKLFVKFR